MRVLYQCLALLIATCVTAMAAAQEIETEHEFWIRHAEQTCSEIEDVGVLDKTLTEIQRIHFQSQSLDQASRLTNKITTPNLRVDAHILMAKHIAESGNVKACEVRT